MEHLKIKYLRDVDPIEKKENSDWIDLRCGETIKMKKGEFKIIPLGVAMQLPSGYEALVLPRSSTFKRYGIIMVNSMGLIDESYCGEEDEWGFCAYAMRDTVIQKNDRICQFRILYHMQELDIETVDHLDNNSRGGYGSTGRN